jgi:hypothetical protein
MVTVVEKAWATSTTIQTAASKAAGELFFGGAALPPLRYSDDCRALRKSHRHEKGKVPGDGVTGDHRGRC